MKIIISLLVVAFMASQAVAGNGDLIVDGKLGVGTTNPVAKLSVVGEARIERDGQAFTINGPSSDAAAYWQREGISYGAIGVDVDSFSIYSVGANTSLKVFANNYERLRVTSVGNILMGTTIDSSDGLLQVGGDSPSPTITIGRTGGYFRTQLVGSTGADGNNFKLNIGPTNVLYANYNGNVGIGSTEPGGYKLFVNGPAYSTGGWQGSDARFKKDILPISTALEKVNNLNGLSYKWKTDEYRDKGFPEGRHYGVIAQEIEKVLPEVVNTAPDGTKAVAYTEIIPVLIEAIKEQQKTIEKQQAENNEQQKRIEKLEITLDVSYVR